MPINIRDLLGGLAALALGLIAFFVLIGWETLLPTNIGWLNHADLAMHTLGWMFFRDVPWGVPPGLSPDLGIELSSSIALVDGLPLFALPLKLISSWLPHPFQYWGYWLLLSFVLQAFFAYRIARELEAGRLIALLAAGFALITPALMFRVTLHLALSGHWVVLAALYLNVRREPPKLWMWPLLLAITSLIHAYLLAIVLALWFAALMERPWSGRARGTAILAEFVIGLVASAAMLWLAGFFLTGSFASYGYGDYKLNLLWPLLTYRDWSQLMPDLPHAKFDYEGISFLGIGILAILVLAILTGAIARLRAIVTRRWLPLTIMLLLLMLFAITTDVHFGDIELFNLKLPKRVEELVATFRSTGRFIWPLLYIVTIGSVVLLGRRLPAIAAVPIILIAFGAQAVDSSHGLLRWHQTLAPISDTWETPLKSPFWQRAADAGYTRVRVIPIRNPGTDWRPLGYYAMTHHMAIDSVYLGRMDDNALKALRQHESEVLTLGEFEPHTLYVLDMESALEASGHLEPGDLLAVVDQHIVFARGGAPLIAGLDIHQLPVLGTGPVEKPWVPTAG